jgi:hypothetical protein
MSKEKRIEEGRRWHKVTPKGGDYAFTIKARLGFF